MTSLQSRRGLTKSLLCWLWTPAHSEIYRTNYSIQFIIMQGLVMHYFIQFIKRGAAMLIFTPIFNKFPFTSYRIKNIRLRRSSLPQVCCIANVCSALVPSQNQIMNERHKYTFRCYNAQVPCCKTTAAYSYLYFY